MSILKTIRDHVPYETLVCPVCDFYYIHPISVKVATGNDYTQVDSIGTKIIRIDQEKIKNLEANKATNEEKEVSTATNWRGARIILEYYCENGHHGEIILQFHKGNTIIEHKELPKTAELPDVIWRT